MSGDIAARASTTAGQSVSDRAMSFLVRAALVIGALSYFASTRDQPGASLRPTDGGPMAALPAIWDALPSDIRARAISEATSQAGRQIADMSMLPASGDTLAESDRKPGWRGSNSRR